MILQVAKRIANIRFYTFLYVPCFPYLSSTYNQYKSGLSV